MHFYIVWGTQLLMFSALISSMSSKRRTGFADFVMVVSFIGAILCAGYTIALWTS